MTELPASSTHQYPKPEPKPPDSILTWGVDLETNYFTNGLTPWLSNPPINETEAPLSELGHFADNTYKLGALILPDYEAQLSEFAIVAFPNNITERLNDGLRRYLGTPGNTGEDWDEHKRVWQTDKDTRHSESSEVRSWKGSLARDEGWSWDLLTDQYDAYIHIFFADT